MSQPTTFTIMSRMLRPQTLFAPHPPGTRLPWGVLMPFLAILFVVVTSLPIELAMDDSGLVDANGNPRDALALALFLLVPFGLLGLLVLGWTRWLERRPLASIGLTWGQGLRTFFRGYGVGLAMAATVVAAIWAAGGYAAGSIAPALASPSALATIALLLLCFAIQASVEEIVFRGWMLSAIARKFGPIVAVVLSTAVFALLHGVHRAPAPVVATTLLFSTFACAWVLRRGDIWGVMGWHSAWNWLLGVGFDLPITGLETGTSALLVTLRPIGPDWLTGGGDGPEGSLLCVILLAGGTLYWLLRSYRTSHMQVAAAASITAAKNPS